jgi:hypothetical protein
MDAKTPSQTKARIIILAIFVIGFAAGALTMNLYHQRTTNDRPERGSRGNPPDFITREMDKRLNLSPEQENQIKAILEETFGKYREIRTQMDQDPEVKKYTPRFEETKQAGRERIRAVLTAEQLPGFEAMLKEQDEERARHEEKRKK